MSQLLKNLSANPGLFLVLGLLVGMLLHNPALGALGGLLCHLIINSISQKEN